MRSSRLGCLLAAYPHLQMRSIIVAGHGPGDPRLESPPEEELGPSELRPTMDVPYHVDTGPRASVLREDQDMEAANDPGDDDPYPDGPFDPRDKRWFRADPDSTYVPEGQDVRAWLMKVLFILRGDALGDTGGHTTFFLGHDGWSHTWVKQVAGARRVKGQIARYFASVAADRSTAWLNICAQDV